MSRLSIARSFNRKLWYQRKLIINTFERSWRTECYALRNHDFTRYAPDYEIVGLKTSSEIQSLAEAVVKAHLIPLHDSEFQPIKLLRPHVEGKIHILRTRLQIIWRKKLAFFLQVPAIAGKEIETATICNSFTFKNRSHIAGKKTLHMDCNLSYSETTSLRISKKYYTGNSKFYTRTMGVSMSHDW